MPFKKGDPNINRRGRKKGFSNRPKITDHMTDEQIKEIADKAYSNAIAGDSQLIKFILEQVYGKAQQTVDMTSKGKRITKVEVEIKHVGIEAGSD